MQKEIKNLQELGTDLLSVYTDLRNKRIDTAEAIALANVAGKVIGTAKVLIDYSHIKKSNKDIPLLESASISQ